MSTYLQKKRKSNKKKSTNADYSPKSKKLKTEKLRKYFMARSNNIEKSNLEISPFIFSHIKSKSKKTEKSRNIDNLNEDDDYYIDDEDMNFELNKEKAKSIYLNLLNEKNENKLVNEVYKCLSYDNTNKEILEGCLELLRKYEKNDDFMKIINYNKFCLDEKYVNLIYEECPTMTKNIYIQYLQYLFNTSKTYNELIKYIDKDTINNLIEYKIIIKSGISKIKDNIALESEKDYDKVVNMAKIDDKNLSMKLRELLKNIKEESFNFLTKYIYIREMDYFNHNQPIDIKTNDILYYNYLLSHLYNKMIIQEDYIIKYKTENLDIIYDYKYVFENIIFKQKENYNIIDIFNFNLDNLIKDASDLVARILEDQPIPSTTDIDTIINNFNQKDLDIKLEKDNNFIKIINPNYEDIIIDLNTYNKNVINTLNSESFENYDFVYKNKLIKYFNNSNYFTERDLEYFFDLIDDILKSNVLKEIWKNHCTKDIYNKIHYYFDNKDNRKGFIKKITFLPYFEQETRIKGLTMRHQLKIFLSGYPYENTNKGIFNKTIKILELGKRIVIIIHEIPLYLKSALSMVTNGIVSNHNQGEIEVGKMLENELFGWGGKNKIKAFINVQQALKLLNSDSYSKSMHEFKKNIHGKQEVKLNDKLKKYLDDIKFNYNLEEKGSDINASNLINCSKTNNNDYIMIYSDCVK